MNQAIENLEKRRLTLQATLDAEKTQAERNRLGQFATPPALALEILKYASSLLNKDAKVRFLDPAIGTGTFYSALQKVFPERNIIESLGFEIDLHYQEPASRLWANSGLVIRHADFTTETPAPRFNLVVCNPPYVRHHYLQKSVKSRLQAQTYQACGVKLGGLAGLYGYFLGLSHAWMAEEGIAGWLIPSEFMDVNYGQQIKQYLLNKVTLLHIHRFDPNNLQFADALVSSAIVWFKKKLPSKDYAVTFTYGGTLCKPEQICTINTGALLHERKWTRFPVEKIRSKEPGPTLNDFFRIRRGLATGANDFFILAADEIAARELPLELFRPILPGPRYISDDEIAADTNGYPQLERRLFLLDTRLSEDEIKEKYPTLFAYLKEGKIRKIAERYLCRNRVLWYGQEHRPPPPIVCTYLGRNNTRSGRPFRFILNCSNATVANTYLAMYPTASLKQAMEYDAGLIRRVWRILNNITPKELFGEGRVYGGGLHKLEPKELANVNASAIAKLIPAYKFTRASLQDGLFDN